MSFNRCAIACRMLLVCALLALQAVSSRGASSSPEISPEPASLRVAIIGGIVMSGLWTELSEAFTAETGIKIELCVAGNKEVIIPAFRKGQADVIALHASDEVTLLVAEGWAMELKPWAFNDLVILGPTDDPAHIRGLSDGAEALRRIARTKSRFIYPRGGGVGIILNRLFKNAGVSPSPEWCEINSTDYNYGVLQNASKQHAYTVVGRIPVAYGKLYGKGLEVLVKDDPDMRRPYVVAVANPERLPDAPLREARALADFMVSEKAQLIIRDFQGPKQAHGKGPLFFPLPQYEKAEPKS